MRKLLPCPFCGGEAIFDISGAYDYGVYRTRAGCGTCLIFTPYSQVWPANPSKDKQNVATIWNKRT